MQNDVLFAAIGGSVLFLLLGLIAAYLVVTNKNAEKQGLAQQDEAVVRRATGRAGRMGRGLQNRRARRAQDADDGGGGGGSGSEGEEEGEPDLASMTRAERRAYQREQERAARDDARAAQREAQDAREAKRQAYDERRRAKEEEREAAEAAALAELQRAEEERQRREDEEAAKWLHLISKEGEGQDAEADGDSGAGLLQQFIDYIVGAKAVALDEVAAEFRLPTSEVIKRIKDLEEGGQLTGVMDDRGKYIYISHDEMAAVAAFIKQRGRVSIAELAAKSDALVDLSAKAVVREGGGGGDRLDDLDLELEADA